MTRLRRGENEKVSTMVDIRGETNDKAESIEGRKTD